MKETTMAIVSIYNNKCESQGKKDEIFVGNTNISCFPKSYLKVLKTARLGDQAYDINDKPIPKDYMRPLFIGHSEYDAYNKIMDERFKAIGR